MKISTLALLTAAAAMSIGTTASADLLVVDDIPVTDVLLSRGDEAGLGTAASQATFGYRNADGAGEEGTRGRGQSFVIDANLGAAYDISSITVALSGGSSGNGTRPEGDLTFTVFEWIGTNADDSADWLSKTGGNGGTQVFSETFDIAAGSSFAGTELLQISLGLGELQLSEDTNYGFFFQYKLDDVTGLSSDVAIAFDSDNNAPDNTAGALLSTNPAVNPAEGPNNISASRDLNYFITGTVVPEPGSLALLGLGGLLIARRRRA